MLEMNYPSRDEWVEALRSGEYRQGIGSLKMQTQQSEAYCCLGVYADLVVKANPAGDMRWEQDGLNCYLVVDGVYNSGGLPINLREAAVLSMDDQDALIRMNDKCNYNFEQIADAIAANEIPHPSTLMKVNQNND